MLININFFVNYSEFISKIISFLFSVIARPNQENNKAIFIKLIPLTENETALIQI